jgi:hypothetical protein
VFFVLKGRTRITSGRATMTGPKHISLRNLLVATQENDGMTHFPRGPVCAFPVLEFPRPRLRGITDLMLKISVGSGLEK